jgi:hypothetical protein
MAKITLIIAIYLLSISYVLIGQPCDTILYGNPKVYTLIDGKKLKSITPGCTICLKAGKYYHIRIDNLHGSAEKPIIIRPEGGNVLIDTNCIYGIRFGGKSSYIKLTGKTATEPYALKILESDGVGISIDDLSTDIEVEGVEIANTRLAGIMAKTDPDCSLKAVRDSFALNNLKIHDNYLHDIGFEGMYIGSSFYSGKELNCNGKDTIVMPHLLFGAEIYNNIVERTGYDGIQVSSVSTDCRINDNRISHDSYVKQYGQMSGIIIGEGSSCDCYNNKITKGAGIGIEVHGFGGRKIFNNLIVEAGRTYKPLTQGAYSKPGIYVAYNLPNPQNQAYKIFSNTIVNPKSEGIRFSNINSSNNLIYNNIIINPGIWHYYDSMGVPPESSYINVNVDATCDVQNNFGARNAKTILFVDSLLGNYRLQASSPAVNTGIDLYPFKITYDLDYQARPYGGKYDIGAYEYFKGQGLEEPTTQKTHFIKSASFSIVTHEVLLEFDVELAGNIYINLFDSTGKQVVKNIYTTINTKNFRLAIPAISSGTYILQARYLNLIDSVKLLIFNQ